MTDGITPPSHSEIRQELQDLVLKDLLGPASGENEIVAEQTVRDRYILGLLAPKGQTALPDEDDALDEAGRDTEEGPTEPGTIRNHTMLPSSLGLTFTVDAEAGGASGAAELQIRARWGRYERHSSDELGLEFEKPKMVWRREQEDHTSPPIPLKVGRMKPWKPNPNYPDIYVDGLFRRRDSQWVVTLFFINGQEEPKKLKDKAWIFQPELVVSSPDGAPFFRRRQLLRDSVKADPEEQSMAMLYRNQVEFAVGHGVAVKAELAPNCHDCAVSLQTVSAPTYELPRVTPPTPAEIPALQGVVLDMKALGEMPDVGFAAALRPLTSAYAAWIEELELQLQPANLPTFNLQPFDVPARQAIDACKMNLERIQAGIDLLGRDSQAAEAFRFANRSMWLQRTHSLFAEAVRRGEKITLEALDVAKNRSWYPFQLAFVLLNLPSLADPLHQERSHPTEAVADVLWFPTGGGKTEAYLGLTAFTLGIRRLQGIVGECDGSAGVAVLMRYTLRLLTLQQFQRAAALICACESLRQDAIKEGDGKWGSEPFRIGLWVGQRSTPNWTEQSAEVIQAYRGNKGEFRATATGGSGSPHQLNNCPWCGTEINPGRDIQVETYKRGRARTLVYCPNFSCLFNQKNAKGEGLPILVVDEEVYRRLPSLLIATVDKFAQMPWKGESQALFGRVSGYCTRHGYRTPDLEDKDSHPAEKVSGLPPAETEERGWLRPPDLIIQDELHLISGPLGTLVGLYETAVDNLCSWKINGRTVRPKVIASSATIRKAPQQVASLYLRLANVFPPNGLLAADNFFSRQRQPSEETPGRLYLGICAPGARHKTVLIRVYVAALSAAQRLYEKYGGLADPWMTLVGYFNSLRELGGMRRVAEDAVRTRLRQMDQRGMTNRFLETYSIHELTSRIGATDIPEILDRLGVPFDPAQEEGRKKKAKAGEKVKPASYPIDVLLATNMISVGVDVPRLGLMVTASQPKNSAEYIQATSRIGRRYPGLVITVYNWARPRDISHYEHFEHYHATLYQQVEALSVTPFSPRALDRGLTALLVSYLRLFGEEFNSNEAAGKLSRDHPYVQAAIDEISKRAGLIATDRPGNEVEADVRRELEQRIDHWLARARKLVEGGAQLGYKSLPDGRTLGLLESPGSPHWDLFTCLTSLRDVEPAVNLILNNYDLPTSPGGTSEVAADGSQEVVP